jgi:glutaminyl-peptide cyclotransferase
MSKRARQRARPQPPQPQPGRGPARPLGLLLLAAFGLVAAWYLLGDRAAAPEPAAQPDATLSPSPAPDATAEALEVQVLGEQPHDSAAFTQGLVLDGDTLYESTGQYGASSLREVDPATGEVRRKVDVPAEYFAEGLALVGERLIQLTWREGVAFVYDRATFEKTGEFHYSAADGGTGEGWGLCYDGERLVMSDGGSRLLFRDPGTFAVLGHVDVTRDGAPQIRLNELECVGDDVYANVWTEDIIVRIDKASGVVEAVIDAAGLLTEAERQGTDVLNGIAYDPAADRFLITGKYWPKLFEARFVRSTAAMPYLLRSPEPHVDRIAPRAELPTATLR